MPEPMFFLQRGVGFDRTPTQIAMSVKDIPIFVSNDSVFIPCPADIAVFEQRGVRKYQSVRLLDAKMFNDAGKIVDVAFAASTIQPEFHQVAVITRQLL